MPHPARNTAASLAIVALVALLAAGCGSTATGSGPAASPTATRTATPASVHPTSAAPAILTASQVTAALRQAGLPITKVTAYTAADDPNHLLGRPGQYTSKTEFADTGIHGEAGNGVAAGGSVEVYPAAGQAMTRARYIQRIVQAAPALGVEYDYVAGDVVLRVSGQLTPAEAAGYGKALAKITGARAALIS